jgi:hypothetical protein
MLTAIKIFFVGGGRVIPNRKFRLTVYISILDIPILEPFEYWNHLNTTTTI